jgi:TonB-linked SusC/RagA family outer membrane protein
VKACLKPCLAAIALLFAIAASANAQQRTISGRVGNSVSDEAVAGATVSVVGTSIAAVTDARGQFSLSAPDGAVSLMVRAIGYKRRTMAVPADQSTVAIAVEPDIFNLEAVVVTGQATAVEQKNLPQAVSVVTSAALERVPTPTIESALQGKIPGALIQSNSGAPGGGAQINLRGVSTINGGVDPVLVVDGLVVSNAAIGNNINAITAAAAGGNASNQDNPVNRIADLNPADIERVEVLKGASAAAIYGGAASNGVVIITTKRGSTGAPRFHLTQRFGQFRVSNYMKSRVFTDSADAASMVGDSLAGVYCNLPGGTCPNYDNIGPLWNEHQLSYETDASITGGSEQTRYYLSGLLKRDGGIAPHTGYDKQSIRANLDQTLGQRWLLSFSTSVIHSLAARGISNNDNTGTSPYLVFPLTPGIVNLEPVNGVYPDNPFERSNPIQTYAFLRNDEDVWRALGAGTLRFDAFNKEHSSLRFVATGGLDYFNQQNDIYSPPELEFEPNDGQPGTVVLGKTSNLNLNLLTNVVHTYQSSGGMRATTALGVQYVNRDFNFTNLVGRNLPPGQQNVDQATSVIINQQLQPQQDLGVFAQEELLTMDERLMVAFGVRADRSSRNGDVKKFYYYPKIAGSYRFVNLGGNGEDELKIRAAYGQTGNPPQFGNKFTPNATGTIGGIFGSAAGAVAGDPGIKPERQTEVEAGFDATLAGGRLTASVTGFNKAITDLLLVQTLAPSSGRTQRTFNGGKLRNRGIEIGTAYAVTQRADVSWILNASFFANRSKVISLPVPAFQVGGFGTSLGAFEIRPGHSVTQIVGTPVDPGTGLPTVVGDANPDFQMAFGSDLEYHRWNVSFLFDWKKGGDVINLTELLFDLFGNSADYHGAAQQRLADFGAGKTQPYVQDASYLKLRELSLSYHIPASTTASMFGSRVRDARITLSGRNLIRITNFRGMDPEVSNFGNQAVARNIDVAPFPPSRSFFVAIDLDF